MINICSGRLKELVTSRTEDLFKPYSKYKSSFYQLCSSLLTNVYWCMHESFNISLVSMIRIMTNWSWCECRGCGRRGWRLLL